MIGDVVKFEEFELDLRTHHLVRSGHVVKLERIPMELLVLLVEHQGQLITREHIVEKLWGKDVFLDTDNAVNTAVRKVRHALQDEIEQPRFLQTVSGRGYRFIARVTVPDAPAAEDGTAGLPTAKPKPLPLSTEVPGRRIPSSWKVAATLLATLGISIAAGVLLVRWHQSRKASEKRVMLAVLPFLNLSDDPEQEYFSDGLTEETITDLGELSPEKLGVIARTSSMAYKHTDKNASQVGWDLGVDYILEGSVRRDAERVRISVQLIRVADQSHIWAQSYDHDIRDILRVQAELGDAITHQVQLKLSAGKNLARSEVRLVPPEAYDLYLRGLYAWNQFTPASLRKSTDYFQQAIKSDPNYAQAYAGLAESYGVLMDWNKLPPVEAYSKSEAAARRAVELDSGNSEAHSALGWQLLSYDRDYAGAEQEFERAIALNSSNADAHDGLANYFAIRGQFEQSVAEVRRARDLDPLSLIMNSDLGKMLFYARRYDEAIQQLRFTLDLHPDAFAPHYVLWMLYQAEGHPKEADTEFFKMTAGGINPAMTEIQRTHARLGWKGAWQKLLATKLVTSWDIAGVSLVASDRNQTLALLQRAADDRLSQVIFLGVDPRFDGLRSDPTFQVLLQHLGLGEMKTRATTQ